MLAAVYITIISLKIPASTSAQKGKGNFVHPIRVTPCLLRATSRAQAGTGRFSIHNKGDKIYSLPQGSLRIEILPDHRSVTVSFDELGRRRVSPYGRVPWLNVWLAAAL